MARNDNPHALRLHAALCSAASPEAASRFSSAHPLSKSADFEQKAEWAQDICASLTDAFDGSAIRCIRRACRCGDGKTMAQQIAACIAKAGSLQEGCRMFTLNHRYAFLEYVSDHELRFGYHACVCSCVKRADCALPLTWCECSCGYAEAMFRQIFGDDIQVDLLGSVKAGSIRCEMRVTIP